MMHNFTAYPFCNDCRLSDSGRSRRQTVAAKLYSRYPPQGRTLVGTPSVHNARWVNSKLACLAARLATAISPAARLLGHGKDKTHMSLRVPFPFLQIAVAGITHVKQTLGSTHPLPTASLRSRKMRRSR